MSMVIIITSYEVTRGCIVMSVPAYFVVASLTLEQHDGDAPSLAPVSKRNRINSGNSRIG